MSIATTTVPTATDAGMLGFFHTIEKLKTNKRTGWVNAGVRLPESIADHMYRMAMMALVSPSEAVDGHQLDISRCVMMALVHDIAEADVGDITPEEHSGVTKAQKLEMEAQAMNRIAKLLGHPSLSSLRVMDLWHEYEARETPESKFVKDLDQFELAVQAVEYENSNNLSLQEFFQSTVPRIQHSTARQWARDLMEERRKAWEARGWDYVPVLVKEDEKVEGGVAGVAEPAKGMTLEEAREERGESARIPTRVWGEHSA